jgi:hypothetical protein
VFPLVASEALMETLTDDRLEPHLFLAAQLLLLLAVAVVLFVWSPAI